MSPAQLSVYFFFQMFLILAVCRLVGLLAKWIQQPQVVGEMIAGVLLGPSVFGLLFPHALAKIFPAESISLLYVGAQLGVGLYMFLVGVEFSKEDFIARVHGVFSVSIAGLAAPFALGALLSIPMLHMGGLLAPQANLFQAMLFTGAAMSITAFPMLARIIYERGLTGSALGSMALAAGAMNDAAAWCLLAVVLASFGGGSAHAVEAIGGGIAYTAFVLSIGRILLKRLGTAAEKAGKITPPLLAVTLMLFLLAVWITDGIGLHAVFGGFLLGVAMPRGLFARELQRQLEPFTVVFLLPMFFTYSGLKTRLDMVNSPQILLVAAAVIAAACLGKGGACWMAARFHGENNRTALAIGALMNARGLMELILINIGLQKGLIQAPYFSIMVLMAVVTTLMATPVFEWVYGRHARLEGSLPAAPRDA